MKVSEQIDQFIAENGGNERDALNVALTRLELAQLQIEALTHKANQWDDLDTSIGLTYDDDSSDLCEIGEIAARAFGYY